MLNGELQKAGELSPQDRQAIEGSREAAWDRLIERIDRTAAKAKDVPESEIDAAIDEACEYVRTHPQSG